MSRLILLLLFLGLSKEALANNCVGITNANTGYIFVLSGYTGGGAYCCNGCSSSSGADCYPTLPYNASQAVSIPQGGWLYLQYDMCTSVSYSSSGQATCGGYAGYIGLTFSGSTVTLSSSDGGTATLGTPTGGYYPVTFTPSNVTFGIQNATSNYFVFTGQSSSSDASCNGGSCYATLSPGAQQFVTFNPSGWINLQYEVCGSVSYSDEGVGFCSTCTDLGSFGVTFTSTGCSLSNTYNGSATLTTNSNVTNVDFTSSNPPCPLGTTIPTPQTYTSVPYRGVNLAGCDFQTFTPPCACDAVYFAQQGCNTIRLPVLWEYLQGNTPLGSPIDFTQGDALTYANLVTTLTSAGLTVIIDMHNYMRYDPAAPGQVITGPDYIIGNTAGGVIPGPTAAQYATAWGSIAAQFATNPHVMFDLMNEPNDMTTELILSNYNTAIAAIRSAESGVGGGIHHRLLLEGNQYSCLGSWEDDYYGTPNSTVFVPANIIDSANNYAINVHEYFNGDGSESPTTACGSGNSNCVPANEVLTIENFSGFISYLQANQLKAILTELNGIANSNCAECVSNFLTAVQSNPDTGSGGFIGWTGWAGGSFDTTYILNLSPTYVGDVPTPSYQFQYGFQPFLTPLP